MKIANAEALFAIIKKSGLLNAEEIAEARAATQDSDSPQSIAARLAKSGQLTEWQVRKLLAGQHALFLGKYKLLDRLDWGDSGRVYLAEHTRMRNRVALKTLGRRMSKDSRTLELFKNEGRTAASLDHQNVIKVYDFDFESDYYFFVMEFVEGRDLQHVVETDGKLPPQTAASYIRQAALGLAHAHAKKVYHGDLKPANLLVDARGSLKIIDLGAARMPRSEEEQAAATNQYMPPEQISASDDVNQLVDIYALGATMYFLLFGEPPIKSGTSAQRLADLRGQNLQQALKDIPEPVRNICAKMMAEEPADRYHSADEVALALQKWQDETRKANEPAQSRGDRPRPRTRAQALPSESSEFPALSPAKAATETLDFAIDIQPRKKKKSTAAARAAAKAAEPKPAVEAEQKSSHTKWIVAGVGATVALVAVAVLAIVLWPSSGDAVAKKDGKKDDGAKAAAENPEDPEALANAQSDENADEPEENSSDGEMTDDEKDPEKDPDKDKPEAKTPKDDPAKKEPEKTEPPKTETPATTTPPAEPPKTEPPKTEPAPAPTPPPPKKPFMNFTKAVAIPDLPEGAAAASGKAPPMVVLGTLADKVDIQIDLLGGDECVAGKPKFDMTSAGNAAWTITLHDGAKAEGKPVKVADVSYNKDTGEVIFQWADTALPHRESNFLRNAILNLRAGTDQLPLSMRTPSECPPFVITIDKPKMMAKLSVPFLPEPKLVQVEVTTLEGTFPPHKFDPGPGMVVGAPKAIVKVRLGKDDQFLTLEITGRMSRTIDLMMTPTYQFPGQEKALPLVLGKSEGFLHTAMALSEQLTKVVAQGASIPVADVNGRAKLEQITRKLADVDKAIPQLQAFDNDCKALKDGRVHLRVIYKIDEHTVELANSEQGLGGAKGGAPASVFDKVK